MLTPYHWECQFTPIDGALWRVYVSDDPRSKGSAIEDVPIGERTAYLTLPEGTYYVRVLVVGRNGTESPWDPNVFDVVNVTGRENTPPALAGVAVGQIDPLHVRVVSDPPTLGDDYHRLQAVEMPTGVTDPELGYVLSEWEPIPGGPLSPNGPRMPSPLIPVEGAGGNVPATRALAIRAVGPHGTVGAATTRTVAAPERPHHYRIAIASCVSGVLSGIASPTATDPWELDASDGIRLRAMATVANLDSDWGTVAQWGGGSTSKVLGLQRWVTPYMDSAIVTGTADVDLGASVYFELEAYVQAGRKAAAGYWGTAKVGTLNTQIVNPTLPETRGNSRSEEMAGPGGLWRHVRVNGKPRQPLRGENVRVQYVVGDATPLGVTEADWLDYVPGLVLKGRYVRVRLKLLEATGWHQIIVPRLVVSARVLMSRRFAASITAPSDTDPPGSFHVDENTGTLYFKASGVSTDWWKALKNVSAVVEKSATFTPDVREGEYLFNCDTSSAAIVVGTPAVSAVPKGWGFWIRRKNAGGNSLTIDPNSTETVNGSSTLTVSNQYEVVYIVSDGSGWVVAAGYGSGGGSGASTADKFLTFGTNADLSNERVLTAGGGVKVTDAGSDGGAFTIDVQAPVSAKSADYTVATSDREKCLTMDASGAARTFTLPAAATAGDGFRVRLKKVDSSTNTVTVDGHSTETIDGATTIVLRAQYEAIEIVCDGSNWYVVAAVYAARQVVTGMTRVNPAASSSVGMMMVGNANLAGHGPVMPRAGRIIQIGWYFSGSHSAGTATISCVKNGVTQTGLQHVTGTSETRGQTTGEGDTFAAGDDIGMLFATDGSWNGTSGVALGTFEVRFDLPQQAAGSRAWRPRGIIQAVRAAR